MPKSSAIVKKKTPDRASDLVELRKKDHSNLVGARLASFRKLNALSLQQVATRAGITKSYLSKLERGLSSPTIATMLKLAGALDIRSEQLIEDIGEDNQVVLVKAEDRVPFCPSTGREGYTYEAIATRRIDKAMMPFIMCPPPTIDDKKDLVSHSGEELIYLISGEMEVIFADRVVKMNAGDSLYFNGSIPHRSRSTGPNPATALVVVADPRRARLM